MRYVAVVVSLILFLKGLATHGVLPVSAQGSLLSMSPAQQSQLESRLNLLDSQKPQVLKIVQRSIEEREAVLRKYGITLGSGKKPGLFQLIGLNNGMKSVDQRTRAALSKVLSPGQMREYDKISAEQREEARRKLLN